MITSLTDRQKEVGVKLSHLRYLMAEHHLTSLTLNSQPNQAWITAGARLYIHEATENTPVSIVVTADNAYAITDTIETPRMLAEEQLKALGFEVVYGPWYEARPTATDLGETPAQDGPGTGRNMAEALKQLRCVLQPNEVERARYAGKLAAEAMAEALLKVRIGDSEHQVAAYMTEAVRKRGALAVVALVASDARVLQYRHPLPADKKVSRYAMLVLCVRHAGLVISLTRLVHFGPLPNELADKAMACAKVDSILLSQSKVGRPLADMFGVARDAYAAMGFPEAIEEHHQGGIAGYTPREFLARPDATAILQPNQLLAWNPSIRGVKSEDTVLLTDRGIEVLTATSTLPTTAVQLDDSSNAAMRPAIFIR
jgi:Xaa-Pro aminopeptidase